MALERREAAVKVERRETEKRTFHGRDGLVVAAGSIDELTR